MTLNNVTSQVIKQSPRQKFSNNANCSNIDHLVDILAPHNVVLISGKWWNIISL